MKFLNVYCTDREKEVFINLDKIVLITKESDTKSRIQLTGDANPVMVDMPAEDLVRKINGEDRVGIGFRTGGF